MTKLSVVIHKGWNDFWVQGLIKPPRTYVCVDSIAALLAVIMTSAAISDNLTNLQNEMQVCSLQ